MDFSKPRLEILLIFHISLYFSVFFWIFNFYINNFELLYYVFITISLIILLAKSNNYGSKISFLGIFLFGFYMSIISAIGILFSGNILHAAQAVSYLFCPVLFYLLGYNLSINTVRKSLIIIFFIVSFFTFLERIDFWFGINTFNLTDFSKQVKYAAISSSIDPAIGRATSVFINPNQLGFFAGCIVFSILSLSDNRSKKNIFLFIFGSIVIFLSGSRGSIIALTLSSLVYLLYVRSYSMLFVIVLSSPLLYFLYLYLGNQELVNIDLFMDRLFFDSGVDSASVSGRIFFWENIFNNVNLITGTLMPPELVLGHAIDSFYMRVVAQAGILGLILSLFLLYSQNIESNQYNEEYRKAGSKALIVFISINSLSMLGVMDLEAAFVWSIFGIIAKDAYNYKFHLRNM